MSTPNCKLHQQAKKHQVQVKEANKATTFQTTVGYSGLMCRTLSYVDGDYIGDLGFIFVGGLICHKSTIYGRKRSVALKTS